MTQKTNEPKYNKGKHIITENITDTNTLIKAAIVYVGK